MDINKTAISFLTMYEIKATIIFFKDIFIFKYYLSFIKILAILRCISSHSHFFPSKIYA